MKPYEYISDFKIKYCDVDFKDEMKPSVALALMEEVACDSASELGFGYEYVKPRGMAFVVSSVCVEFLRPVSLGETVSVKTWPTPPSFAVFGREYQFLSKTGDALINATSRWCLLDVETGKILSSKVLDNQDYSTYNTRKLFESVKWKLSPIEPNEAELRFTMTVKNSEYDHNYHINNTRYADYCFNCFSVEELAARRVKRFAVSYVRQCKEDDVLSFYRKQTELGIWCVQGFNQKGETVTQAYICFEE